MERHVAILGGGAAGLSAALFLHGRRSRDQQATFRCTVFDASSRLGGNCLTAYLGSQPFEEPFADLGVNDFNTERYKLFMGVLDKLQSSGYPILHQPIIDSTSWSTPPNVPEEERIYYTDRDLKAGKAPLAANKKLNLKTIAADWDRFQKASREVIHNPRFAQMTVDEFIREMNFSQEFSQYNLLACVNGMYFVDEHSPGAMPIRTIMNYYHLQKGIGLNWQDYHSSEPHPVKASPRHYFVNGSSDWIRQLANYLQDNGVEMRLGAMPVASLNATGGWRVVSSAPQQSDRENFDLVISAVHAETVQTVVDAGLPARLPSLLNEFRYSESTAMVHEDSSILPADQNAWSTYNLTIYPKGDGERRPYTITYVERKHHGEEVNAPPFVTLMPSRLVDGDHVCEMLAMPGDGRIKAVVKFKHNMLSMGAMNAQKSLRELQGENHFYLTGGWAIGVGLHEEILAMSREVALRIRGYFVSGLDDEGYRDDQPFYLPKYIRDTFIEAPELFPPGFWD